MNHFISHALAAALLCSFSLSAFQTAPCQAQDAVAVAPNAANYRALATEVETNLERDVLEQWFPRAIDSSFGGFKQDYANDWSEGTDSARSIVYQSRLTWVAAQEALRQDKLGNSKRAQEFRRYSRHGLDFLVKGLSDAKNGGLFWAVDLKGAPDRDGQKHVYGISFAIYAVCANFRATHDPRALKLAQDSFRWLELHAHDGRNGGFFESLTREGRPILQTPQPANAVDAPTRDQIGTPFGIKSMNTHIHLLEAFTSLYEIWPDAQLRGRLRELFFLVRDRIAVEPGALNYYFALDWQPIPDHDSYGHDIETAYLLDESAHVLKLDDARTQKVVRSLVDNPLRVGYDTEHGGFYDGGGAFGGVWKSDKVWWVQAEALNALLLMHEKYGRQTSQYWDAFVKQWRWIQTVQVDAQNRGWNATVSSDGSKVLSTQKSNAWTEAYHQGRALFNVSAALHRLANEKIAP